ncbi:MAG: LCP family protein [Acidimicrobiia bacterium]
MRSTRPVGLLVVLALIGSACGGDAGSPTTTTTVPPTTTSAPTTLPPTTTTEAAPISAVIDVVMEGDDEATAALEAFYSWVGDRTLPLPAVPAGLLDLLAEVHPTADMTVEAVFYSAEVDEGRVAVVTADDDIVLLADEGSGWEIVGGHLARFGVGPWYGGNVRHVLILGTDKNIGSFQPVYRADSIHILSANVERGAGSVVGFPRDTYVQASYGKDKFSSVNARSERNSEEMVDIAEELSGLEIDGYIVTGFGGFMSLVNAFGGVVVDVPFGMAEPKSNAFLSRGVQRLFGEKALGFSRNRRISGGDFTRSFHQGMVILGALDGVLEQDVTQIPTLLAILQDFTWTNLSLGDLLNLATIAFTMSPTEVTNQVLPGTVGTAAGGASVVFLDEETAAEVFEDLQDGVIDE